MTPDSPEHRCYLLGISHFNAHAFFEAHDAWEEAWHMADGVKRDFYQGLIQSAVALVHYQRSNPRGVKSLFGRYLRRFKAVPGVFMGLDVARFLLDMHRCLRAVLDADPPPAKGQIKLDESMVPKIELLYDPFETGEAD